MMFAIISQAQVRFLFMPEVSIGVCGLGENVMGEGYGSQSSSHFGFGGTLGWATGNDSKAFNGVVIARDGYGFTIKDDSEEYVCAVGSTTVGVQYLYRWTGGFIAGGVIGVKFWDNQFVFDGESWDLSVDNEFICKGKLGYSWKRVALMGYLGADGGITCGFNASFPLYRE